MFRRSCAFVCLRAFFRRKFFRHLPTPFPRFISQGTARPFELSLPQTDKITLTAEAAPENKNTTFRWQLLSSVTDGEWINIFDGTSKSFTLSYLTVENLLDESGSVYLRACAANNDLCGYSEPTAVTVYYNVPEDESSLLTPAPQTTLQNDESEVSNDPEYVDISINYLDSSAGLAIYSGYSAQIQKRNLLHKLGYLPHLSRIRSFYNKSNPSIKKTRRGRNRRARRPPRLYISTFPKILTAIHMSLTSIISQLTCPLPQDTSSKT